MSTDRSSVVPLFPALYIVAYTVLGTSRLFTVQRVDVRPSHVVLVVGSGLAALLLITCRRTWPPLSRAFFACAAAFLAWVAASWAIATGSNLGLLPFLNYGAAMAAVLLVVGTLGEGRHVETTVGALLIVTAMGAVLGAVQLATSPYVSLTAWVYEDLGFLDYGPIGYSDAPTAFGLSMLVGYVLGLSQYLDGRTTRTVQAGLVGGLAGVLIAGTRSTLLAACLASLYLWVRVGLRQGAWPMARIAVLAVLLANVLCLWFPECRLQFYARVTSHGQTASHWNTQSRLVLWKAALGVWREHPIAGVGLGRFREEVNPRLPPEIAKFRLFPHNVFLGTGVETGGVGLALYLTLLGLGFAAAWRSRGPVALGLQATIIAHSVDACFHNYQFDNHIWVLIGLALAMGGLKEGECAPATSTK